jgi:DNA-binding NtrC family response regulator
LIERFRDMEVGSRRFEFTVASSVSDYLEMQKHQLFDLVILDISLFENWPERTRDLEGGLEIAEYLRAWNAGAVVVMYSASLTVDGAVRAMRSGAYDCVDKSQPGSLTKLVESVRAGLEATWVSHETVGRMLEALSAEFAGKYVAIDNGAVVASDNSLRELKKSFKAKGERTVPIFVHVAGDA